MTEGDSVLVQRAQRGDETAFGLLVERYLQPAYAVALGQLNEPADAEDVCQDAFIAALEKLEECRSPDKFGSWLLSIVRNRARDYRRYRTIRDAAPLKENTAAAKHGNPEREVENAIMRDDLLSAMEGLTETQREVLLLYDFEGWSHKEIAEKVGISVESARVHLHNGRKALRKTLTPLYEEER